MVQGLRVTVTSASSIVVSWREPTGGSEYIIGYKMELSQYVQDSTGRIQTIIKEMFSLSSQEMTIFISTLGRCCFSVACYALLYHSACALHV